MGLPGQHGSREECFLLYIQELREQDLAACISELRGKVLVCDCAEHQLCHTDVLIAEALRFPSFETGSPLRTVILAGMAQAHAIPWTPSLIFVQEEVIGAFAKLYPPEFTSGLKAWPMIEDLLQHKIFHQYREWRAEAGMSVDGALGPTHLDRCGLYACRVGAGRQQGALAHKAALPPVVSFGLEPDDHFAASLKASSQPSPLEGFLSLDDDIHCPCGPPFPVRVLARSRTCPGLVVGFPTVGYAPPRGAFAPKQVSPITLAKVLKEAASHNLALLRTIRPGQMYQFILDSGLKDAGKGFSTEPLKWEDLMKHVNHRPVRLIPRFAITQSTGKVRPIDDADKGGQSELSSDGNHLEFCLALRPAACLGVTPGCSAAWVLHHAGLCRDAERRRGLAGWMPTVWFR